MIHILDHDAKIEFLKDNESQSQSDSDSEPTVEQFKKMNTEEEDLKISDDNQKQSNSGDMSSSHEIGLSKELSDEDHKGIHIN